LVGESEPPSPLSFFEKYIRRWWTYQGSRFVSSWPLSLSRRETLQVSGNTIDAIDDEPITDEDFDNFASNRVNFIRELDL